MVVKTMPARSSAGDHTLRSMNARATATIPATITSQRIQECSASTHPYMPRILHQAEGRRGNAVHRDGDEPTRDGVERVMVAAKDSTRRNGESSYAHRDYNRRRRAGREKDGGERFGRMPARERVHLDAARVEHPEIDGAPARAPRISEPERPRRPGLNPRQARKADVIRQEHDGPESLAVDAVRERDEQRDRNHRI